MWTLSSSPIPRLSVVNHSSWTRDRRGRTRAFFCPIRMSNYDRTMMNSSRHNGSTNKYLNLINIPTVSLHIASRIGSPPVRPRTTSGEPEFPSETDDRGVRRPVLILRTVLKMQLVAGLALDATLSEWASDAKGSSVFESSSSPRSSGRERSSPARLQLSSGPYHLI